MINILAYVTREERLTKFLVNQVDTVKVKMQTRWIIFAYIILLGQVGGRYCELLSGVLYVCNHHADEELANIEVFVEPNDSRQQQVVYIHSSPAFRYLRIRAKITGCRKTPLTIEKYLIPGDLGLASDESRYLLALRSDMVLGQHVYHVTRINTQSYNVRDHIMHPHPRQSLNDSITVATGLGCGQIQSYQLEALGATLCTPYQPHHAAQSTNGDHSFRVYADDSEREELPSLPPQENPTLKWKPFIPWMLIRYFSLRSWQSRAEGMALVLTLGMYLVYLLFKSRKVIQLYTPHEQERRDERIV